MKRFLYLYIEENLLGLQHTIKSLVCYQPACSEKATAAICHFTLETEQEATVLTQPLPYMFSIIGQDRGNNRITIKTTKKDSTKEYGGSLETELEKEKRQADL